MSQKTDRYLSMAEVADLMKLGHTSRRRRAEYVRRLIRRLEERDQREYLVRLGARKYYVAVAALEQLLPWDPGTLSAMRDDIRSLGQSMRALKRQSNAHGARLRALEKFSRATSRWITETSEALDAIGRD